jgi:ribosome biogenesis GTPase
LEGLVLKGIGGFYTAMDEAGNTYTLRAQAKIRRQHLTPMVGDRVEFMPGNGEEDGWLSEIKPRKNQLIRPPVANIDLIAVVVSAGYPAGDYAMIDKMLLCAKKNGIPAALVVNKCDEDGARADQILREYRRAALVALEKASARTGEGIDKLRALVGGKTYAFGGQSGVGKSSILNRMYGFGLKTGSLSEKLDRGKHTTRHVELLPVPGGMALDTPGFSLLELETMPPEAVAALVAEFEPYAGACYFSPCEHDTEPNCAVKAALARGEIDAGRYERYVQIVAQMRKKWRERYG